MAYLAYHGHRWIIRLVPALALQEHQARNGLLTATTATTTKMNEKMKRLS